MKLLLFIIGFLILCAVAMLLDRWHRRWAMRNARRRAREIMEERATRIWKSQVEKRPPPPQPVHRRPNKRWH